MFEAVRDQRRPRGFQLPPTTWPLERARRAGIYNYAAEITRTAPGRIRLGGSGELISLASCSYLGLLGHPRIEAAAVAAIRDHGTGTGGVRLLAGTTELHRLLEERIAAFKGAEACLTFNSGYLANVSTIAALVGRGDFVIGDKLNHASIVDGCRLSGAKFMRFKHNDPDHLAERLRRVTPGSNVLVVCDAVFSMDGDIQNLPAVAELCRSYGALLMVDEAHALGVIGATGRGIEEHFGLAPEVVDIKMGALSKAIPSVGGYVCASAKIVDYLKHQGRGFIYSAALSPANAAAAIAALDVIEAEPERIRQLHENATRLRRLLNEAGIDTARTQTPIVPVFCGDDMRAAELAHACYERGVFVQGVPYPVAPPGKARLRCSVTAEHTCADIEKATKAIVDAVSAVT